jgi:hypothetical protein
VAGPLFEKRFVNSVSEDNEFLSITVHPDGSVFGHWQARGTIRRTNPNGARRVHNRLADQGVGRFTLRRMLEQYNYPLDVRPHARDT